jgi:hypothetical protein
VPTEPRCPGTGMQMVLRIYRVRAVEESDRAGTEWRVERAQARGDLEGAQIFRESLQRWEAEQGQENEVLVCPGRLSWRTRFQDGSC